MGARLLRRWTLFNSVGAVGVVLQLGLLSLLVHGAGLHYLLATVIAVEATIVHNFFWHQRWTWKDRPAQSRATVAWRLARFNVLNGGISLAGNVVVMALLTGAAGVEPALANLAAIAICSVANFAASETLVFNAAGAAALALLLGAPHAAWAGPGTATVSGWKAYETTVESRYAGGPRDGGFFVQDTARSGWRSTARRDGVRMLSMPAPSVDGGQIHHWVGSVFVPGVTLDDVLAQLRRHAGNESRFYEDVLASRLLSNAGDRDAVYLKLRRDSIITVTYNTEHLVEYRRLDARRATSRSVATKIAELANAGTPGEREKPAGSDHGFLWRLNAYWRYEQVDGGVLIECESVSLSRSIPVLLRPFVTSTVDRIARESLEKTLRGLRTFLTASGGPA